MSKELIKIIFILISFWSFGQEVDAVQYSLLFKDCCSNDIKTHGTIFTDWFITDSAGTTFIPENNIVHLKKSKVYYLNNEGYGILNQPIYLNDSNKIDTIINSCILSVYPNEFFTWNPIHLNCEDTINGGYVEYYPYGTIRINGNFENGRIKDSMITYYSNGRVKSSIMLIHNDTIYKSFHPNGQISHLYNSSKKNTISYFEDGSVKSKRSNSYKKKFNRYSPNQLWYKMKKSKQISYYRNGKINQKLKVKPLYFIDRFKSDDKKRTLDYAWTVYDTTGCKAKEVNFYSESKLRLYSTDFYRAAKKYSYISYLENDKTIVSFFCEYYSEENISFPVKYNMLMYENGKFKYMKDLLPSGFNEIITEYEVKYKQLTLSD